jgi:hypothetical protein
MMLSCTFIVSLFVFVCFLSLCCLHGVARLYPFAVLCSFLSAAFVIIFLFYADVMVLWPFFKFRFLLNISRILQGHCQCPILPVLLNLICIFVLKLELCLFVSVFLDVVWFIHNVYLFFFVVYVCQVLMQRCDVYFLTRVEICFGL